MALSQLARGEALAAEQRLSFVMEPLFLRGAAFVAQDAADEAIAAIRDGLAPGRPVATIWQPFVLCFLAEALGRRGDYQEAHAAIRQALGMMNATGERMWNAELHRIHGLVLLSENMREESEASLEQALRIARDVAARIRAVGPRISGREREDDAGEHDSPATGHASEQRAENCGAIIG